MIVHSYLHSNDGGGLGDFLRGSLACHQLCGRYNIPYAIDFSKHSIGNYLIPSHNTDISSFREHECRNVGGQTVAGLRFHLMRMYKLSSLSRNENNCCIYTNTYPTFPIREATRQFTREALVPNQTLSALLPVIDHEYEVIHIRAGDLISFNAHICFIVDITKDDLIKAIIKDVQKIVATAIHPVIIMSDSVELKNTLAEECGVLQTQTTPQHLTFESASAVDTLIDYFTLSKARKIHQFSVHPWGSGFSDTVNWIYGVPLQRYTLDQISSD